MMKRERPPLANRQGQAGVAMLEVLVSVLLFSFGILGLIGLQARAVSFSVDAEDRNRAALLANEIASTMWITRSVTVDVSDGSSWQTRIADPSKDGLPGGEISVTTVSGTTNSADIEITWQAPSRGTNDPNKLRTRVVLPQ
ncbi:type IV pilus modification protein PilV [Variovorax sp. J2P1-59]|uniref:type IV pilus modification protein PilV n=1 Tax=Variovorax flavidus TaxID=3053501 RepID=UPI0025774933|nr:type IV pilus modification protein PilV [Variovorax sp. J2P1-59]MDM0075148.1 type IV pilus modification protein PilV [Variovorax sp. J2P1-59]